MLVEDVGRTSQSLSPVDQGLDPLVIAGHRFHHGGQRPCLIPWFGNCAGQGLGAGGIAKESPYCGQIRRDLEVTFDEAVVVHRQPGHSEQVRLVLADNDTLRGFDLGESSGVTARDVEHPIMTGRVGGAGDDSGQVCGGVQHAVVAA